MPLPIRYPDAMPGIRGLSGRMHDLNEPLVNPSPHDDWSIGDIAWVYMERTKAVMVGPITYMDPPMTGTDPADRFCHVQDLNPDKDRTGPNNSLTAPVRELFRSELELMDAMLRAPGQETR